jgi:hypothetical protein
MRLRKNIFRIIIPWKTKERKQNEDILLAQTQLVKWNRAYFWATVVMAIAAIFAGIFTWNYVHTTQDLLKQTQNDSRLEFRPYVIANYENLKVDTINVSPNSITCMVSFVAKYINPGRTPAINFQSASCFDKEKQVPRCFVWVGIDKFLDV